MARILFASSIDASFGGSEYLWTETSRRCIAQGHEVSIFLPYYKKVAQVDAIGNLGARIFYGSPPPRRIPVRIFDAMRSLRFTFDACKTIARPDLTIISMGNHIEQSRFFSTKPSVPSPYVLIVQLAMFQYCDRDTRQYFRELFRNARAVVFVSNENKELTEVDLGIRLTNSSILGNDFRRTATIEWPMRAKLSLAVPARLEFPQKGHDLILRALKEGAISEQDVTIRFYSEGSSHLVREYLSDFGIANVEVLPFDTLENIWSCNHGLLLTSRYEGMSLAMLEAMWLQRPAFVTPTGGVKEVVRDGVDGFVADSNSLDSIKCLLQKAVSSCHKWREMGIRAGERVRDVFRSPASERLADQIKDWL